MASGGDEPQSSKCRKETKTKEVNDCEPCETAGKMNEATRYCKECDEYLCDKCVLTHKTMKATRHHLPITTVPEKGKDDFIACEPCESAGERIAAISFCETCREYLCNECTLTHKTMKATKNHTPVAKSQRSKKEEKSDHISYNCYPCTNEGKTKYATKYCELCDEFLCDNCTLIHTRIKVTKSHAPVPVSFVKNIVNSGEPDRPHLDTCEQCEDITEKAVNFCHDCNEKLCSNCSRPHSLLKMTMSHKQTPLADIEFIKQLCELCEIEQKSNEAVNKCKECDQLLCEKCVKLHRTMKVTKTHEIVPVEAKVASTQLNLCHVCDAYGSRIMSKTYCEKCDEYFCKKCSKIHEIGKMTKTHILIDAAAATMKSAPKCEMCYNNNVMSDGKLHCTICEEYLCEKCMEMHKRLKQHKVIKSLEKNNDSEEEKQKPGDRPTMKKEENQKQPKKNKTPGKPRASNIGSDFLTLSWDKPSAFKDGDFYQVSCRDVDKSGKWKLLPGEFKTATADLTDLKSNTKFMFRVRVMCDNEEYPYSDIIGVFTTESPAARLVDISKSVEEGKPSPTKYILPMTEKQNARNAKAKTRKFDAGTAPIGNCKEKTIMLVGATGSGKSTLVDGIANYVLGVNWDDPFRFTIVNLEEEEKQNQHSQADSQTEWITCYSINPEKGSRVPYKLNIIDTPGFGDTRGLERDQKIVEQIRQLFTENPPIGVSCIDAVCFLIKAPDARLTSVQSYIFQSVMSLFGKDIENNICSLVTFADGKDPPVMAALLKSGLPFGKHFSFNNSALYAKNVQNTALAPLFWKMGILSFRDFFDHLEKNMVTKSLQLTKAVLDERFRLETTVRNLQPQLDLGLFKANQMQQEIQIIEQNKSLIKDNKNFEYEVTETRQKKKELADGFHVTNCTHCHFTCHENCGIPEDSNKSRCSAMQHGSCIVCPNKCAWQKHANTPYVFEYETVKVTKTYAEMEKKYQEASGKLLTQEQVVEKMGEELAELSEYIEKLMFIVKECNERLSDTALRPNPLTMTEHIDLMIESEKLEKKDGFMERIATLNGFRQRAQILSTAEDFNKVAKSTLGAAGTKQNKKKDMLSILKKMSSLLSRK